MSCFDVRGPGNRVYGFSVLKLRRNVLICMDNVCYDLLYDLSIIDRILRERKGQGEVTKGHYT